MSKTRSCILALLLCAVAVPLWAAPVVGHDYRVLDNPQPTDVPAGKIEVLEFFSFGCPYCYQFEPVLKAWVGKLPKDVVFRRVPMTFERGWDVYAKTYYALRATGNLKRLADPLFDAIHKQHLPLADEKSMVHWVASQGVDAAKFKSAYDSFGVNTRVAQTSQVMANYQVDAIPTLAIAGKYVVLSHQPQQMLAVAGQLIDRVRAQRKRSR